MENGEVLKWEQFVEEKLLRHGVVNGVALISRQCRCIYSHGYLQDLEEGNWQQFGSLFNTTSSTQEQQVLEKGFMISLQKDETDKFEIYKKTHCSIYAASHGNQRGLVVCNLPYGILICAYALPLNASTAIKHVEQFCDLLRT